MVGLCGDGQEGGGGLGHALHIEVR
jgi:hypothetical protein